LERCKPPGGEVAVLGRTPLVPAEQLESHAVQNWVDWVATRLCTRLPSGKGSATSA